jgi:serine/threonine protein kinase/Flp pilus assembly protein TadD
MIGQTISHYKILEKLGEGGMGVVYRAEDTKLKREVAIKFLPRHIAAEAEKRERFKIEAQAAAALNHPNIATIHAIEEVDDDMFIVMEYIDGHELKEQVAGGKLQVENAFDIAIQVAEGLKAAHDKGTIHRDIKSSNLMITNEGQVKIMDFGLAKILGGIQVTKIGTTLGTIAYMSPEQAQGKEVDLRTDIWSFGVVLYEMLTGEMPFKGDYEQAVIYSILNEEQQPISGLSSGVQKALEAIIQKMLCKDLDKRYQQVEDVLLDLTALHRQEISTGPPATPMPRVKSTIAVLPFNNISCDLNQGYFADGVTEDIITALSKNRWLLVIARYSSFAFKDRSMDVRHIAAELGADYVVEGSVRKSGNRIRISAQLIDAVSGSHLWAERYDRDLEDIFAVQNEITETIAARIEPEIGAVERQRAERKPTKSLDAWDFYHLGLSYMYKFTKEGNAEARRLFRSAIELDPKFAEVYAQLAYCQVINMVYFDAEPTAEILDDALRAAKTAVALDDRNALAHFTLGRVHLARCEYELSIAELETAIELNPCLAVAHCGLGDALAYTGRLEDSISHFDEAIRLSPHDPYRWGFLSYGSLAYLFLRQHEKAAEWARNAIRVPNSHYWANAHLVAALGHLNRPDEARTALEELLHRKPEFSCEFAKKHLFYIRSSAQLEHYLDGLRKVGVSEETLDDH